MHRGRARLAEAVLASTSETLGGGYDTNFFEDGNRLAVS